MRRAWVLGAAALALTVPAVAWAATRWRGAKVTAGQLRKLMPRVGGDAEKYLPHLQRALDEAEINTPRRIAAFLAQVAHESGELSFWEELASGEAYEGRRALGNSEPGDGARFRGRGPLQLTGRANYMAAGRALGLDLENHPAVVATPAVGFRTAAWYWRTRGLNGLADAGNFDGVTRRINGGYNGKASRDGYYATAKRIFGA